MGTINSGGLMDFLLQPSHLIIILVIVIVLFGPGKLPSLGVSFGRRFRSGLFMAQGVDPEVGRDVGDMLPDEHLSRSTHLHQHDLLPSFTPPYPRCPVQSRIEDSAACVC